MYCTKPFRGNVLSGRELVDLFDDLAGSGENRDGDREAERLSRLQVDDEVEGRRLLDRKITRVFALENAIHVNGGATKILRDVRTIRHETARLRIFALGIDRGQRHGRDALDDHGALIPEQCVSQTMSAATPLRASLS